MLSMKKDDCQTDIKTRCQAGSSMMISSPQTGKCRLRKKTAQRMAMVARNMKRWTRGRMHFVIRFKWFHVRMAKRPTGEWRRIAKPLVPNSVFGGGMVVFSVDAMILESSLEFAMTVLLAEKSISALTNFSIQGLTRRISKGGWPAPCRLLDCGRKRLSFHVFLPCSCGNTHRNAIAFLRFSKLAATPVFP